MYEYEFRIAAVVSSDFPIKEFSYRVSIIYAQPNFRWRQNKWETKKKLSSVSTFYDGLWFKLIESKEKEFRQWNQSTHKQFIHSIAFSQNPFKFENRIQIDLGPNAKFYKFHKDDTMSGIAFELEIGTFSKRWKTMHRPNLTDQLAPSKEILDLFRHKSNFPYTLKPSMKRKPVKAIKSMKLSNDILIAKKYDGVFGFVYSYLDRVLVCEYWEGNERSVKRGVSLGDGIVYGAERMKDGTIILLDVYQVRGLPTIGRKRILTEFLPQVSLPTGFRVQTYYSNTQDVPSDEKDTDGLIFHDTKKDCIFKQKSVHTIDLVYMHGYFRFPDGKKMKVKDDLVDGAVYEIDIRNKFKILKRRNDRFTGNTEKQLKAIYKAMHKKK